MKRHFAHLLIFAFVAVAHMSGLLTPADRLVADLGFEVTPREASGNVVVVEIDARSLHNLNVWPWPRTYHGILLDNLRSAGARRVAFDIDFSSRSREAADRDFAEALKRAEGHAILPVLKQLAPTENGGAEMVVAVPIRQLGENAALAHVNILPSADDRIRHYLNRENFGDVEVPGLASALAGDPRPGLREFDIDYGILPESVPRLSYMDVMQGKFDPGAVAGKDVIVGATAIELGDRVAVPVHGVIAGPVLQALAYETLVQGRTIAHLKHWPGYLLALLLAVLIGPLLSALTWRKGLLTLIATSASLLTAAIALQAAYAVLLSVTAGLSAVMLSYAYAVVRWIDRQAASIYRERMLSLHRRAMMSTVVESGFDGIVITDDSGRVQICNASANAMMGWGEGGIVGRQVDDHLPRPELPEEERDASAGGRIRPREVEATRADGTTFTMELVVSTSRMSMASGKRKADRTVETVRIFTFRDITERKNAELARQRAMEEAIAANRAKTEFLANMSHELRTPLNAIIGFSDIMKTEALGPLGVAAYADFARDISDGGHRLLEVVEEVLDMSRIESGEMEVQETEFDVVRLVESSVEAIRDQAGKGKLVLGSDIGANVAAFRGDERMIGRILRNLLSNAVKFTPAGGAVSVRTRRREDGGLAIEVADTGIGIPADDLERVFEPFTQVDGRLQREFEGTGLGLPAVRSMAEMHGGRVTIESVVDRGTTVRVEFPADRSVVRTGKAAAMEAAA